MIIEEKPLSMAEAKEYLIEEDSEIKGFIKKFVKLDHKKAKEFTEKIKGLDLMKVKDSHIAKIIDLTPENGEELNKIFVDVILDENETSKILEIVKQFI